MLNICYKSNVVDKVQDWVENLKSTTNDQNTLYRDFIELRDLINNQSEIQQNEMSYQSSTSSEEPVIIDDEEGKCIIFLSSNSISNSKKRNFSCFKTFSYQK